jgi:hypothetical protein
VNETEQGDGEDGERQRERERDEGRKGRTGDVRVEGVLPAVGCVAGSLAVPLKMNRPFWSSFLSNPYFECGVDASSFKASSIV